MAARQTRRAAIPGYEQNGTLLITGVAKQSGIDVNSSPADARAVDSGLRLMSPFTTSVSRLVARPHRQEQVLDSEF